MVDIEFKTIFTFKNFIIFIGSILCILTFYITFKLMYRHLKFYISPDHQRYIIRILIMVPFYSILTLLSIVKVDFEIYFSLLRDCYESYVIYCFFALLINYVGDKNIVIHLETHEPIYILPYKIFKDKFEYKTNEKTLQYLRIGILQYVIIKPLLTLLNIVFTIYNIEGNGLFQLTKFYPYQAALGTISVSLSLYFLTLFLDIMHEEIKPYHPILKFLSVKLIVALCFWQIYVIIIFNHFIKIPIIDGIKDSEQNINFLNNCLIIIEMFLCSILHNYAYPYELYRVMMYSSELLIRNSCDNNESNNLNKNELKSSSIFNNFIDSLNQKDMIKETVKSIKGTKIYKDKNNNIENNIESDEFLIGAVIEMGEFQSFDEYNINSDLISSFEINDVNINNYNNDQDFISDEFFLSLIKQNNTISYNDDLLTSNNSNNTNKMVKIKR